MAGTGRDLLRKYSPAIQNNKRYTSGSRRIYIVKNLHNEEFT
jgi:hypothetical protein